MRNFDRGSGGDIPMCPNHAPALVALIEAARMFRFTIRDVLWLTVVVALAVGCGLYAARHNALRRKLLQEHRATEERLRVTMGLAEDLAQLHFEEHNGEM